MSTYNGTGAPPGWNWCLSYLATAGILIGFDASGHVAEETKNASVTAARGIFWSTVVSGFGGLATIILFLFCAVSLPVQCDSFLKVIRAELILTMPKPDPDTLFSFGAPQPFVPLYAVVLGKGGHIFMNIVCVVALWFVSDIHSPYPISLKHPNLTRYWEEHRNRHRRGLPPRLRRRARRRPPLLVLGLARLRARPAP